MISRANLPRQPSAQTYSVGQHRSSPPKTATTLLGGMPGHPTALQKAIREFVLDVCRLQKKPSVDLSRLYLTGFSYGGIGAYALGQHFPADFAAVVPIAALPPLPEYFSKGSRRDPHPPTHTLPLLPPSMG